MLNTHGAYVKGEAGTVAEVDGNGNTIDLRAAASSSAAAPVSDPFWVDGEASSIVVDGDDDIIVIGEPDALINTETGKNDVVFLPSAVGQPGSGATIVISPGITTLVGGGANDKLVFLADRLGDGSGGQVGTTALSDSSDTLQLLGGSYGINGVGGTSEGGASDGGSGSLPGFDVDYEQNGDDLLITVDAGTWNSQIWIKDYRPGDFGLIFGEGAAVLGPSRASSQVDEDPGVSWQNVRPALEEYGQHLSTAAPASDATIVAALGSVLSGEAAGDDDLPTGSTPDATAAPTISNTTPNQVTTGEAPVAPFSGVSVGGGAGATETVTIVRIGDGTLSGPGLTAGPGGTYTLAAADPATITAELQGLTFAAAASTSGTPSVTTLALVARSSSGASAFDAATTVTDTPAPFGIDGTLSGQATSGEAPLTPFAGATVVDGGAGASDTVTITLSGGGGTLAGAGLTANPDGSYTLAAADPATVTAELQALTHARRRRCISTSELACELLSSAGGGRVTADGRRSPIVVDRGPALGSRRGG